MASTRLAVQENFDPKSFDDDTGSLAISMGRNGARLSHNHQKQFVYGERPFNPTLFDEWQLQRKDKKICEMSSVIGTSIFHCMCQIPNEGFLPPVGTESFPSTFATIEYFGRQNIVLADAPKLIEQLSRI